MKILVAEDNKNIAKTLKLILEQEKYFVDNVYDGDEAIYFVENSNYDLIILDIMMPKKDGYEVTKYLREKKINTPILMLTAKGTISDKVRGLDFGADDYLIKPFDTFELLARVRALTRRVGEVVINEFTHKDLTLNLNNYTVTTSFKTARLSKTEFDILKILLQNKNKTFSKDNLISSIWGFDSEVEENNVEVYISFLRKKLKFVNSTVEIKTIRNVGYCIEG